jgi:glutathione S-transferase
MSSPRLWSWNLSPFAGKVRVAAAEKGVEFDLLEIHPVRRPPRLRELNPTNRVPVLEVDGVAIRESTAICEWLDETYPEPPLWPSDPARRAAARGMLRWVDDELTSTYFLSMRKQAFGRDETDPEDIVDRLQRRFVRRFDTLEGLLGHSVAGWLAGSEHPTLADLAAIPLAVRLPQWTPDLEPDADLHPLAAAWFERLRDRPSAAEVDRRGEPVED